MSETTVRSICQITRTSTLNPVASLQLPDNGSHREVIAMPENPTILGISSNKIGGVTYVALQFPNKPTMDLIPLQRANDSYPQMMLQFHQKQFRT
jgi:hypothetical protein